MCSWVCQLFCISLKREKEKKNSKKWDREKETKTQELLLLSPFVSFPSFFLSSSFFFSFSFSFFLFLLFFFFFFNFLLSGFGCCCFFLSKTVQKTPRRINLSSVLLKKNFLFFKLFRYEEEMTKDDRKRGREERER